MDTFKALLVALVGFIVVAALSGGHSTEGVRDVHDVLSNNA